MRDQPPVVPVSDVSAPGEVGPADDTIETGRRPGAAASWKGLALLGLIGLLVVGAIVLASHQERRAAHARTPSTASPSRSLVITQVPSDHGSSAALVEDAPTCLDAAGDGGRTVSMLIRNQLTRSVRITRIDFLAPTGTTVRETVVRTGRSLGLSCLTPSDAHRANGFVARPGPLWIATRLSAAPACGTDIALRWRVTYLDAGRSRQVTLRGAGTSGCPARPRPHDRTG